MSGYLIYHPQRCVSTFDRLTVYHDSTKGNQDPYVWNRQFLHTYCHITQMQIAIHQINFWVSGDSFPTFSHLFCDLVFVIKEKVFWGEPNAISKDDSLVDSPEAFVDHYRWSHQHRYSRRHRFTLKADPDHSFQPQDARWELFDIVPFLVDAGVSLDRLRTGLKAPRGSKPFFLDDTIASALYHWLDEQAPVKLTGDMLERIRWENPALAST